MDSLCNGPLVLTYTIWDDGVHAHCDDSCHRGGWDRNLGFSATLVDVQAAQQAHDAGQEG